MPFESIQKNCLKEGDGNMLSSIGVPGLIIILIIALIIFGPSKLPQIGRAAGDTLREFKHSTKDLPDDEASSAAEDNQK